MTRERVLFLCTGNSCRSQMAEGWLHSLGGDRYEALSAGTKPQGLHPLAVRVMAEVGVDISGQSSKLVEGSLTQEIGRLITVCGEARETCPAFLGKVEVRLHWPVPDPAKAAGSEEQVLEAFRRVRDEIRGRVEALIAEDM